ncbi:hypothetical protein P5G65_30255 [Paenibacillus chondroitinus]|uniref:Uncharacterized protein n=1 Tax=Paenibacillus chondroitinus TaxID=59842 RepID=A0ABU6DN32_9BACL|nr:MULTISPECIES: hypothetical protein [Paenibacillus]MCY9660623.1 hypothetical protein [Paenibacillus anseongense]MEB4798197.1 hypothetical protein [Paenibacillus chondroitinus]
MQIDNEKWVQFQADEQADDAATNHDYDLIRAYADQLNGEVEMAAEE